MIDNEINWIECDGGPHIIIERKYLNIWKGESEEEYKKAMEYYEKTDAIDDYIGELKIGFGKCLVISEDVPLSAWISDNNTSGFLVVANYVSEDYINKKMRFDTLLNEFRKIADDQFIDTNLIYQVTDEELYLLAACDFGSGWLYHYSKFNLLTGNYRIKMIEEYLFEGSSFRLFQFSNLMDCAKI